MSHITLLFLWLVANLSTAHRISGGLRGDGGSRKLDEQQQQQQQQQAFNFSFPSVVRDLHPEALKLKAHSSFHLGDNDPEIFAALQSVLTPYLQDILGDSLVSYDLEIVYSEGENVDVDDIVVTNMVITCVLTVKSDSVQGLQLHTHVNADIWFFDFFNGSNVFKFLSNLRDEYNIDVNEIVFQDEEFRSPLLNGGNVDSEVKNDDIPPPDPPSSGGKGGAIAGALIGILIVGGILLVRYTEKIPWHWIQDWTSSSETSLEDSDVFTTAGKNKKKPSPGRGKRLSAALKKKMPSSLEAFKEKFPSSGAIKKKFPSKETIKKKVSSVKRAAIQKKPAFSSDYPTESAKSRAERKRKEQLAREGQQPQSLLNSNVFNPFNDGPSSVSDMPPSDISFSIDGDYNIPDEYDFSVRSPTISSHHSSSRQEEEEGEGPSTAAAAAAAASSSSPPSAMQNPDEEFSMPDDYNTVNDEYSIMGGHNSIMGGGNSITYSMMSNSVLLGLTDEQPLINLDDNNTVATSTDQTSIMSRAQANYLLAAPPSPFNPDLDDWSIDGYSSEAGYSSFGGAGTTRNGTDMPSLR
eukprot:scaffold1559_cov114-Cylindrotheca_fusiformis.AAC.12